MKFQFKNLDTDETLNEWNFNKAQEKFWKSEKKFVLFSGGFGAGKSLMLILKAIELAARHRNNYILMGRKTYPELRDSLIKDFFMVCPDYLIRDYLKAEARVVFRNNSEIIFRHLDTIAETEIRSMNLGAAFIDQAEGIAKEVFYALRGRLRRQNIPDNDRKIYLSCNPALTWLFTEFKQKRDPDYEVIEASTLDNAANLSKGYIEDLLKYPESWKKQFVYGIWDESLLSERAVFAREYILKLQDYAREPLFYKEDLEIYVPFVDGHRYQMGIDAAEGSGQDYAAITIADLTTLEEAAAWSGKVPPDVLGEKACLYARMYQKEANQLTLVPEMNSMGLAVINVIKKENDILIYQREEMDKTTGKRTKKLGWRTTMQSKQLLISHFQELLRLKEPKVYSGATLAQFKSFVYTDAARKNGAGAEEGFNDDRLISLLLAFFERNILGQAKVGSPSASNEVRIPGLTIVNGKARHDWLKPRLVGELRI